MLKPTPSKPGLFSVAFKRFSRLRGIAVVVFVSLVFAVTYLMTATPMAASAATDSTLNFQARLESSSGAIAPDGTYNVTFHLFNALTSSGSTDTACSTDTNCLWEESYTYNSGPGSSDARIHVANGYMTANLGSITAFPTTINWDQQLYLTMDIGGTVGSGTITWDGQMSPRLPLTAVPYAFRAGALASNVNSSGYDSNLTLTQPAAGVTTGNENFVVADQGAAGTYDLLTGGSISGATAGVVLQSGTPGTQQAGNFNISGTGLLATLDATGNTLAIGPTNATTITIGNNSTTAQTINIGSVGATATASTINIGTTSDTTHTQTIKIGSTTQLANSTVISGGGTGGVTIKTGNGGTVSINDTSGGTTTDNIGAVTNDSTSTVNINSKSGGTDVKTVNIGSTDSSSVTNIQSGTGAINLNASVSNTTNINTGTSTGTVNIGNNADIGGVNILADAASQLVTSAGALTINSAASASWTVSGTNALTLGPGGAGTVNLQAGASGGLINIGNNGVNYSTGNGIQIGQSNSANTASINIGTNANASGTQLVAIGTAASSGSTLTLEAGTGAAAIQIGNGATAHGIQIGTGAAVETLTIGSTNTTSATSIQGGTGGSINIGSVGSSTLSSTTHIADTSNATGTQKVTIGSTANTANTVTLQAGATSDVLSNTSDIVKNSSNSTSAFQVQATGGNVFTVDTTDNALVLGNDGTPTALTVRGGAASGNNLNGGNITFQASNGTGAGGSGSFIFQTAPAAGNAIGTDGNTSTTFITTGTSLTSSFVTGSQTNRIMIVQLVTLTGRSFTGVTYNGVALTRLTTKTSANAYEEVWYLVGPASGTHNLVATENTSGEASMEATTFYNVDPTTPLGTAATAAGTTTGTQPTSLNVSTSTTAQVVVDAIAIDTAAGTSLSNGAGQTQLWNYAAGSGAFVSGSAYKAGTGGTVNMSWNVTSSDWADIGVPLNPTTNSTADTYSTALDIASTGNIGIDNTNPQYSLDVAGTARIQTTTNSINAFQVQNSSGVTIFNVDTNGNAVTIGNTSSTLTLEGGSGASAIQIGNGATVHGIQIGTGAAAETVTIGSTNTTSATTIQAGSGNITLNGYTQINQAGIPLNINSTGGAPETGITMQVNGTLEGELGIAGSTGHIINQTAANDLALKSINGNILFAAGSSSVDLTLATNGNLTLNDGALVLYNTSTAPTEVNGGMYYNTTDNTFECGDNGSWTSCGNGVLGVLTSNAASITSTSYTNFSGANFTPPAGDCQPGVSYLITADGYSNSGSNVTAQIMDFGLTQAGTDILDMHNESTLTSVNDNQNHSWTWNMTITCQTLNSVMVQGFATSDGNRGSGMQTAGGGARTGVVAITSGGTFQLIGRWRVSPGGTGFGIVMTNFIVQRLSP